MTPRRCGGKPALSVRLSGSWCDPHLADQTGSVTLTQLSAFVAVARLGSVKAAATALGVSEPAVSQAVAALRQHLGDPLLAREHGRMELTPGGQRLLGVASQIVELGSEAESAVRSAQGAADRLRVVSTSTVAEFAAGPVTDAFDRRSAGAVETSWGVAAGSEMPVLVAQRLADVALGPRLDSDATLGLVSEPVLRAQLVVTAAPTLRPRGMPRTWTWLLGPRGAEPDSTEAALLRRLGVPDSRVKVFGTQTTAWEAAAAGAGVAPGTRHLLSPHLRRGDLEIVSVPTTPVPMHWYATTLRPDHRRLVSAAFHRFLGTPEAIDILRSPTGGVPPSRFRPPVYVTIWN
jgi:LysR family transcriptional regulator, low CO2-responsive transcriptional regulator